MMVRYATLAYGAGDAVYRHASMLLLSLLAHAPYPREIVVVTDRPVRFAWFDGIARSHPVTLDDITTWQGVVPFSMRVKLEVARHVAPRDGALVLLDADTIATADLTPMVNALAERSLFMHKREFELASSRRRGNRALWRQLRGRTFGRWQFRPDDGMWNSGVIALPATDVSLLEEALELYDVLAREGIRHFATEQLAAGLVLGRTGRLREAERWVTHYWGNRAQFDAEISRRLEEADAAGLSPVAAVARFRKAPITLPAEVRPGPVAKLGRWFRAVVSRRTQRG